jgi:hypothetical protein
MPASPKSVLWQERVALVAGVCRWCLLSGGPVPGSLSCSDDSGDGVSVNRIPGFLRGARGIRRGGSGASALRCRVDA